MSRFTFSLLDDEDLIVDLSTSLSATVLNNSKQACRKLFSDRRVSIGKATMSKSELIAIQGSHSTRTATRAKDGNGTFLYLTWEGDSLSLEDELGMPPTLESPIFRMASPKDDKIHYLSLNPQLQIVKRK